METLKNILLPIAHYPLPFAHYPLPISYYPGSITHVRLFIFYYSRFVMQIALPMLYYPLPITLYPLPVTLYPLPIYYPLAISQVQPFINSKYSSKFLYNSLFFNFSLLNNFITQITHHNPIYYPC